MINGKEIGFENNLTSLGYNKSRLVMLAGDASTRRYFRLFYNSGTRIVMEQEPFEADANPFNLCHSTFSKLDIRIPHIYQMLPEKGIMVLQDLGDTHLQNIETYSGEYIKLFTEAVDVLCGMQKKAMRLDRVKEYPLSYGFDFNRFYSELQMTTDYYIKRYRKRNVPPDFEARLNDFYSELTQELIKQPFMLLHRDYHSRNLIVHNNSVYVIDFQDARMGPYTYDLASLIIDPYANLDEKISDMLVKRYFENINAEISYDLFMQYYNFSLLQRGIKILGTFAYQHIARHNDVYLKYIPISVEKITKLLNIFPRWESIVAEVVL